MIEVLPYAVKVNGIILKVVNASNPFVSYDLEPKREALQVAMTELFEVYSKNEKLIEKAQSGIESFTDEETQAAAEMDRYTRKSRDCQIEYFKECFEDFDTAKNVLRKLDNTEIWDLFKKIQLAQFGGNSDSKKKIESESRKKSLSKKGIKRKK